MSEETLRTVMEIIIILGGVSGLVAVFKSRAEIKKVKADTAQVLTGTAMEILTARTAQLDDTKAELKLTKEELASLRHGGTNGGASH
jgi:uncharacterized membrane protein YqiK